MDVEEDKERIELFKQVECIQIDPTKHIEKIEGIESVDVTNESVTIHFDDEEKNNIKERNVEDYCINLFGSNESLDDIESELSSDTTELSFLSKNDLYSMDKEEHIHLETDITYTNCIRKHQSKVKEFIQLYFERQDLIRQEQENQIKLEKVIMEISASESEYENLEKEEIRLRNEYISQTASACCNHYKEMETINKHEEEVLEMENMIREQLQLEASVIEKRRRMIMKQYDMRQNQIQIRRRNVLEARRFNRSVNVSTRRHILEKNNIEQINNKIK
jgi:hypothetical protein